MKDATSKKAILLFRMSLNKDYDYFLVDVFYQDKSTVNDPFSTRIFLYSIDKNIESPKRTKNRNKSKNDEDQFDIKKSYFDPPQTIFNNVYSSDSIFEFDKKSNPTNAKRRGSAGPVKKKRKRLNLIRIFTYLSEDPLKNPFNNIEVIIKNEQDLKSLNLVNPTYTTLGTFQPLNFSRFLETD